MGTKSSSKRVVFRLKYDNTCAENAAILGDFRSLDEAYDRLRDIWAKENIKPYYTRFWTEDNVTTIDYGSHFGFYKIERIEKWLIG